MNRVERIKKLLIQDFKPEYLDVKDDSASHIGHAGSRDDGETHYNVTIVAKHFVGLSKIAKHKAIYKSLKSEMECANAIHALQIKALSPDEI